MREGGETDHPCGSNVTGPESNGAAVRRTREDREISPWIIPLVLLGSLVCATLFLGESGTRWIEWSHRRLLGWLSPTWILWLAMALTWWFFVERHRR